LTHSNHSSSGVALSKVSDDSVDTRDRPATVSAIYYPHTQIRDRDFLKSVLLTWDQVEYISPYPNFEFEKSTSTTVNDALDLICRPYTPTEVDKQRIHARLVRLLSKGVPSWLSTSTVPESLKSGRPIREYRAPSDGMGIYPRKLDERTWKLLEATSLAKLDGDERQHYTAPLLGFLLMSMLADACAGAAKQKITDRADAYSFLWKIAVAEANAEYLPSPNSAIDSLHSRLVTISVKAINTDNIPLKNLLEMRTREARSSSAQDYRAMRRRYMNTIHRYARRLVQEAKSQSDWNEIERQFQIELQDDIAVLSSELRIAKSQLLFSKEVGIAALAAAGLFLEPVSSSMILAHVVKAVGWGALVSDGIKFKKAHMDALSGHPASWLYLNARPSRDIFKDW
jgi:hypothetical protein